MHHVIGILAHVDAGKTTFAEQVLYQTRAIRKAGRVDHQDTFLDTNQMEKARGITIFTSQASFTYEGNGYDLLDTPGHVDFSSEMERTLDVLDSAVVVISAVEGIQSHTETVLSLLKKRRIPTLLFINKTDRAGAAPHIILGELKKRFSPNCFFFPQESGGKTIPDSLKEEAADVEERLLEAFLEDKLTEAQWKTELQRLFAQAGLFPCFCGSALQGRGIEDFLRGLSFFAGPALHGQENSFGGKVYKVRYDTQRKRWTYIKVTSGSLQVRQEVGGEKISELRRYNGEKYAAVQQVEAGCLCAAAGLSRVRPGDGLGNCVAKTDYALTPALSARVLFSEETPVKNVLEVFQLLEEEDPALKVRWQEKLQQIQIQIMGGIQLEVLRESVKERFDLEISFGPCEVMYQETIAAPVVGYGHFEPLRHYAEVHLKLEPGPRGSGITFGGGCSTDSLPAQYQNLIRTHIFEKEHRGVLTGSPLTDVKISILTGCAHQKHTEGGDFREAVYRAVRQGLEKARSLLLEPMYLFEIRVPPELLGRVLADAQRLHGSFAPPVTEGDRAVVRGSGPVSEWMNYTEELAAYSKGRGQAGFRFGGYAPCHNSEEVIARIAYDKERDVENTSDSVFCAKGSGFLVKWEQAEQYMHCK